MSSKNWRFSVVTLICVTACLVIILKMFQVQGSVEAQTIVNYGKQFESAYITVYPARGTITDRYGSMLAGNEQVFEVGVDLSLVDQAGNPQTIAKVANDVLGVDYTMALAIASIKYDDNHRYAVLKDFVTADKITEIEKLREEYKKLPLPRDKHQAPTTLTGLTWTPHLKRTYPEGALASDVLGFYTFLDRQAGSGMYGVEQMYNTLLAGTPQKRLVTTNPHLVGDIDPIPPGATLVLTIDRSIQASLEASLDKALNDSGAISGTIIVMDPKTGEILGMANSERYDLNEYWKFTSTITSPTFNRSVSNTYEPGSVFKVLTMSAAIDAGVVTPDTTMSVPYSYEIGGGYIYNWDGGAWGTQTMTGCMQHSLNVCLAKVAELLGPTKFYEYLKKFNVGLNSGVDIAGEYYQPLRLPGDESWYPIDLGTNSFGQGLAVAPIQLAAAINAVANDGKMMTPHILKAYIVDGRQYDTALVTMSTPISAQSARTMTEMLTVSLEEEASTALVDGYRVAGKTGTAEIPTPYGYTMAATNASFVGWGPSDDPHFLVYIWLEKPTKAKWGSVVAAPVFAEVFKNLTVLTNLPPDSVRLGAK
jgi:cell division protein FtsI/penicillin-binding protein 2